jgi:HlyD family secretion protein
MTLGRSGMGTHSGYSKSASNRMMFLAVAGLAGAALLAAAVVRMGGVEGGGGSLGEPSFPVARGPLTISVTESGTIKAREQIVIKNEVEGRTTILFLIPEGTQVKEGELLVQLDASRLEDEKVDQQIKVLNAEAAFVRARENLAVVRSQAESDIDKAELDLRFAGEDLKKYEEGEFPQKVMEAEAKVTLADEEQQRAKEKLVWSGVLYEEKYLSQLELQADELAARKAELNGDLARAELDLLKGFTYRREMAQLESDVKQNTMALDRVRRKAAADIVQAEAELKAKKAQYEQEKNKERKGQDQIAKTRITAPAAGLVVYATSARATWRGNTQPLEEGQEVRERQDLIHLPTAASFMAEIKVHESSLKKISPGMPVAITIDALPGERFSGTVANIAPLPDAQSIFLNPDLKIYRTEIHLDGEGGDLRTGMSCRAEIVVNRYEDTLFVPVQAVIRVKGEPTVYVRSASGWEARKVEIGEDNNRMVRIIAGVSEAEEVLLTPPLAEAEVENERAAVTDAPDASPSPATDEGREGNSDRREERKTRMEQMSPEERAAAREKMKKLRGDGGSPAGSPEGR